ncbi:MAG: hypothetical protein QM630_07330 [Microbacterium sp.]
MLGTPLQTAALIGMVALFAAAGVLVCIAAALMAIGALQRVRLAADRRALPPSDPARQRRVRRLMLIAAILTAASFALSALGQFI